MKIVLGFLFLCILVIIHELGHFIAAKLSGVEVESFSVGFGPILLHKKIGKTDYRLSLLPFGGYCGMKGEKDFQKSFDANLDHIEADSDSMYGAHPIKRIFIAFAGPFANLVTAFIAFTVIALAGYTYYSYSTKITLADEVYPDVHSAAREAGIISGDVITAVNNKPVGDFSELLMEIVSRPDEDVSVSVNRNGENLNFTVHTDFDKKSGAGKIGVVADKDSFEKRVQPPLALHEAIVKGVSDTAQGIFLTIKGIATLFKGADLKNSVSGPARVADMLGGAIKDSFSQKSAAGALGIAAYISISLFIMNLLPVPILDGGLILFSLIELTTRRKMSPKLLYYIQFVGIAFIALLFCAGLFSDITYFKGLLHTGGTVK